MKTRLATILFLIWCISYNPLYAQVKYSFFSINEKGEFNLPQFDLSIPLPAKTGFKTPQIPDKKVMFEIDNETIYCFDLDQLDTEKGAGQFIFSIPDSDDNYLYFQINRISAAAYYKKKREIDNNSANSKIPNLKSKLPNEIYSFTDGKSDYYCFHDNGYLFSFRIISSTPKAIKEKYHDIIKNTSTKDLRLARDKYENRIKYGYYDEKDINIRTEKDKKHYEFSNWEGKITQQTTFVWDAFRLQVTIPDGNQWKYRINAEKVVNTDDSDNIKVYMDPLDLYYNPMTMSWFVSDSLTFSIRSYTKTMNVKVADMISYSASMTKYSKSETINVDGIAMPAVLYGSDEIGSIDLYYEADSISYWLSFSGVTSESLPIADKILSSIKIDHPQLKNKSPKKICSNFTSCFAMKKTSAVELDAPLTIPEIPLSNTAVCNLVNVGIKLHLSQPANDWYISVGSDRVKMQDGILDAVPINNTDKRLTIYSPSDEGIYYNISKSDDTPMDIKVYTENFKRAWSTYKEITVLHSSVTPINGKLWSFQIYETRGQYMGLFTTNIPNYEILVSITAKSYEEIVKKAGYIGLIEF